MSTLHERLTNAARERGLAAVATAAALGETERVGRDLFRSTFDPGARERLVRHTRVTRDEATQEIIATEEASRTDFQERAEEMGQFLASACAIVDSLVARGVIAIRRDGERLNVDLLSPHGIDNTRRER